MSFPLPPHPHIHTHPHTHTPTHLPLRVLDVTPIILCIDCHSGSLSVLAFIFVADNFRRFFPNNQLVVPTLFSVNWKMGAFSKYFLYILYTAILFRLTRYFPTINTPGNVCPPEDISCSCQNEHVAKTTVRYCEKNVGKCVPCEDLRTICHRKCHNGKL